MSSNNNNTTELKECQTLLTEFSAKPEAEPFLSPVDWEALNLPDYPKIISTPMDLGTIAKNLSLSKYSDAYDFAEDVRLVWKNAKKYNTPGSGIYIVAENLSKLFERKFSKIKKSSLGRRKNAKSPNQETTHEDRIKFAELIKQIGSDHLGKVVEIIDKHCPEALNDIQNEEDIEIEVYNIKNDTLQNLISFCEKALNKTLLNKSKQNAKKKSRN